MPSTIHGGIFACFKNKKKYLGFTDAEHFSATSWANALSCWFAIFHSNRFGIFHFSLGFAFNAVCFHFFHLLPFLCLLYHCIKARSCLSIVEWRFFNRESTILFFVWFIVSSNMLCRHSVSDFWNFKFEIWNCFLSYPQHIRPISYLNW